ncbi:MAG: putative sensor/response regulator hybrid protein, partial [Hyphomicrobiales bacterium]|nr:putative sensor/response regulator hybrid protein [Hyphomicrobiales bacterium]
EEALRYLLKEEFAVILLDVLMPGLDGYETAKLVRQREQSKRTPIIFLTAINKEDAHMLRGYDNGAVDYVFKPFEPTILRSKVSVFVSLFEKTREIQQKAVVEQRLLEENLRVNSEKLAAEQALRRSEERQALVLKALPVAIYVESDNQSEERRPKFIAGDILGLTGFTHDAFVDDPQLWTSRVHPAEMKVALDPALGQAERVSEYRWLHADGNYRYFLDQAVQLSGDQAPIAGTLLDVTERRNLQDKLLQSQKLDAIGKLTGGIAHDFNNLLASVLSGLSLIERRATISEETGRVIEMTRHAAKQGAELVNRMLSFSRRQQLQPAAVNLAQLTDTIDGFVRPLLGGLIRLDWEIRDDLWPAYVDAAQLELAIMNLVINARDAMPTGGTITIRFGNRSVADSSEDLRSGDYVVLTIRDTGTGIAPEHLGKVVEPFYTTKEVGKGTGLGLSTAYGFAKQSGGTLRIESALGRGTDIEILLPRSMVEQPKAITPAVEAQEQIAELSADRPCILFVDDSAGLREMLTLQLADSGFEVVAAAGGAEALAMLEREPERFDLILTDFAMPLISGIELVRLARGLRADWPAIIITGYAEATEIVNRPENVPVLKKPFTHAALLGIIAKVLVQKGTALQQHR